LSPAIDGSAFPQTAKENYWTSTKKKDSSFQTVVDFSTGDEGVQPELIENRVRCVHDAPPQVNNPPPVCPLGFSWNGVQCVQAVVVPPPTCPPQTKWDGHACQAIEQMVSNGRFAVTQAHARDTRTGHVWERYSPESKMKLDDARAHCASITADGGGYRLPSKAELETIVEKNAKPTIDTAAFPGAPTDAFWTSSRHDGVTDFVTVIGFFMGNAYGAAPSQSNRVRCVK
jgi:hypothetical protein